VWLDPALTSPFRFYQFWLNADDRDVAKYLRFFTWLDRPTVEALEQTTVEAPEKREAQRTLAREVTRLVHGDAELTRAERATGILYGGSVADASVEDLLLVFEDVPSAEIAASALESGVTATDLVVLAKLAASRGEAARLIKQGGVYVNDRRLSDERGAVAAADAVGGRLFVLRKGKRQTHVVKVI
jgi:tyrosyl-tRNA synthetase